MNVFIGFMMIVVLGAFGWLIALDLDNQKKYRIYTSSKVKARQHKNRSLD